MSDGVRMYAMGNGSETMCEQANRLPDGWEWTGWGRAALNGSGYLYPPGNSRADFSGAAYSNGSWCAYASLDDQEPFAEHEADDDAAFTPEALAAAQRDVEDALWRVDGYGVGEVRGVALPALDTDATIDTMDDGAPVALPGLPGMWTITRVTSSGKGLTVDAVRAVVEPADPEASVHREVVRNPRAFALRQVEPAPVASEGADELARLRASVAEMEASCERLRKRASDNIAAAGLADLYRALEDDNYHTAAAMVQRLANTVAKVTELESDLADLHTRYAETMVAFDDAAPEALRALHKRQVDAQSLDATHGPDMAEKVRAALRKKPVAVKGDAS